MAFVFYRVAVFPTAAMLCLLLQPETRSSVAFVSSFYMRKTLIPTYYFSFAKINISGPNFIRHHNNSNIRPKVLLGNFFLHLHIFLSTLQTCEMSHLPSYPFFYIFLSPPMHPSSSSSSSTFRNMFLFCIFKYTFQNINFIFRNIFKLYILDLKTKLKF